MPRYFDVITIEELKNKIDKAMKRCDDDFPFFNDQIEKDLKIRFDWENYTSPNDLDYKFVPAEELCGYHQLDNGLSFFGFAAGGDWEMPVFGIMYFDGKSLRIYIPEQGNVYNTDTKQAYGNDEVADAKNIEKLYDIKCHSVDFLDILDGVPDSNKIVEDIKKRITIKESKVKSVNKPISERINELKYYGTGDEGIELFRATCSLCYQMNGLGTKEQVETLYKWAKEHADASLAWADEDPEDFEYGNWDY